MPFKRKYFFNENYLDDLDDHKKAYILGLFYADACNHVKVGKISISLHYKDVQLLEDIKKCFDYEGPLYKDKTNVKLMMHSKHLSKKLESYGMVARKSLVLEYPTRDIIHLEYENSFVLGVLDGDGTVYNSRDRCTIGFSGSYSMMRGIQDYFLRTCDIDIKKVHSIKSIFTISFSKREDIEKIRNVLYKDSSLFLERKKKIAYKCNCIPYKAGRYKRKLTEENVIEIRRLLFESKTYRTDIAKRFNISSQILSQIRNGIKYNRF